MSLHETQEKSMDDILSSIRKVISEDMNSPSTSTPAPSSAAPDVIELTQMVQDDGSIVDLKKNNESKPSETEDMMPKTEVSSPTESSDTSSPITNSVTPDTAPTDLHQEPHEPSAPLEEAAVALNKTSSPSFETKEATEAAHQETVEDIKAPSQEAYQETSASMINEPQETKEVSPVTPDKSQALASTPSTPSSDGMTTGTEDKVHAQETMTKTEEHNQETPSGSDSLHAKPDQPISHQLNSDNADDSNMANQLNSETLATHSSVENKQIEDSEKQTMSETSSSPNPSSIPQQDTLKEKETKEALMSTIEPLISETVIKQSMEELSKLKEFSAKPSPHDNAFNTGQKTVDDLMREMLMPLLKNWLNAHLPSLVKWIVTEEIQKFLKQTDKE